MRNEQFLLEGAPVKENLVEQKSQDFALRIVKMYQYLAFEKKEYVLSKQLLRSGTSIGANITEAQCGISRKDFLAKMYIAYRECAETKYWINLLYQAGYMNDTQYESIFADCKELLKILTAITKTTRSEKK